MAGLLVASWNVAFTQQPLQVMHGNVPNAVSMRRATQISSRSLDEHMKLSIVLPLRNQAELTSLLGRLYDSSSPDYHHFLTVDEFTNRFGPTDVDYQNVVAFARTNGFEVDAAPANRMIVSISGTVGEINRAFNVVMNNYQHPTENRVFFAPDREPSLNLGVTVAHISGFNSFSLPHPMLAQPQDTQQPLAVNGSGPGGSYLGSDMRAAYYGGTTLDGNGQAVGLLEFTGYSLSDVNETFSNAGQSYTVPINNVLLDGATGGGTGGGEGEVVLDIVQAIGMAPGLNQVRVYIGRGSDDATILNSMASENIAKQLSCSWGWQPDDPGTDDVFFQEFAAQGQSFFTASGDSGAFDHAISPFFYPAEDAYVTTVGGTHLVTTGAGGAWVSEAAWNSQGDGSGGGISPDNIPIPSWQTGVANSSNGGSTILRNVPDVAMEGDFDNYACANGTCSGAYAGTSFAAPRWAGFMALINQQAVEAGNAPQGGVGFVNPVIYQIGSGANYANLLHDVASGNNDTNNQPTWYSAVTGYDLVTGWGSANGQGLIDYLAGPQVPGFWLISSASTIGINQGTSSSTTISVTDAGGFGGNVTLSLPTTLPTGVTASWGTNPTSGSSLLTLTVDANAPASSTTLAITGTSGALTATTNVTVAVHGPTFAISSSPSSLSINQGASGTSTFTVTPEYGFSGSVNLAVSGLPAGVTATWGTNPTSGSSVLTVVASSSAVPGTATLTVTGTSGSLVVTSTFILNIHGPSFTLSSYGPINIGQGSSSTAGVYVNALYGFTGSVNLTVSGLPSGVTAGFSPNPVTGSSVLTLTASSSASVGSSTLTITGTSGALTSSTTITVGVYAPSFTLASSGGASVGQGHSSTSYVYVEPAYGFSGNVTFSVSGLPSGVTAFWSPNPTSGNSTLTLAASSSAAVGQYTLTITGTSGSLSATTAITLGVYVPTFTLSGPGILNLGQGATTSYYVYVNAQYGFTGSVNLVASGLPSGVTASFTPNPVTPGNTLMKLTASGSAAVGQSIVTITGTSGTQTANTTFTLGVYAPTFTLSGNNVTVGQGTASTSYLYVNPQYGFTGSVNLAVSGLPSGVTASFSPNPTTGNSNVTFTASSLAALGQYTLTFTGTSGTQTATTITTLGVYAPTFTLSSPGNLTLGQGASTAYYVYENPQYGFTGSVNFSVSGLPSGVTASFSPNPSTGNSLMTLTAASSAAMGQYTVTLTGTSGTQTATTSFTVSIYSPTFTLSTSNVTIGQGSSGASYVYVYPQYGFTGNVNLAVSGLPSGVTASFLPNPTPVTSGVYSTSTILALVASSSASLGQYTLTVSGTSGSQTTSTTLTLGVYPQSFTIYDSPGTTTLNQGGTGASYVYITPQYGFAGGVTLTASGLPSGVTASFSPNPVTGSSMLTLAASGTAAPGPAVITITGTSGSLSATTTLNLTVNASSFSIVAAPAEVGLLAGASSSSTISINPLNGFSGSVSLAVSGLPAGVTGVFSPDSTSGTSTLKLTASQSATPASSTATITGTSGAISVSMPLRVTVGSTPTMTSTVLAVTIGGSPVATVASNTAVTLTAAVSAGSTALTTGQVNFCDSSATYCDPVHLLGTAQLTSAGTAALKFIPGPGSHGYKAIFAGTNAEGASSSNVSPLTVTASQASTTTIAQSGVAGNYSLTATVTGQGPFAPSGTVSFFDTTSANGLTGTAALTPSPAALAWVNSQNPATSTQPSDVAVGDFNGDGKLDLAVANLASNSVTIFRGNGDGTFAAGTSLPTGNQPISIVASDFNGDGKLDLAVANNSGNSVTILLGNGDGTFAVSQLSPQTGSYPTKIVAGDFNGDGIPDLAVTNESSNSVTILLGNGDGTFTPTAQNLQAGTSPFFIAVGDFNNDGVQDLAVTNSGSSNLSILLGNGDGTFSTGVIQALGGSARAIAVGDFNGDGIQDLAVGLNYTNAVAILLGNRDGTFTRTASNPGTGSYPWSVAVVDLNGDGIQDLALTNYYSNTVTTLLGKGDGSFIAGPTPATGQYPESIAVGDFDGNGVPDFVVTNTGGSSVTVLTARLTQTAKGTATGISPIGSGSHAIDASYAGDSSYQSSISSTTQLTAQPATPTLTVSPSSSSISAAGLLQVTVSVSGGSGMPTPTGTVTLTSGSYISAAVNLSGGSATISIPAGSLSFGNDLLSVIYIPDTSGSLIYNGASGIAMVNVTTIAPTIAFNVANQTYGNPSFAVSATSNSNGAISYSVLSGPATMSGSTVTMTGVGSVVLQASQAAAGNYDVGTQIAAFTVAAAAPVITLNVPNHTYGDAPFTVFATSISSGAISYSVLSGPASISDSTVTLTGVGSVAIRANQVAAGGYPSGTQTASFSVAPESQTISFAALASPVIYGSSPISLIASSDSGLAVVFRVLSGPASISGRTLTFMGAGTVVVAADQAGNANYAAASEVTRSVAVSYAVPAVGLTVSSSSVLVQNAVTLTATVASTVGTPTGTVVFSDAGTMLGTVNISSSVAMLSISTLAVGSHSITATYSGDGNFSSVSSNILTETVQDFTFTTGSTSSQTIQPGGTATFMLPMSLSGGTTFPAAVTFSTSGLPGGFTTTFSPSSLAAGSSGTNVSLMIQAPVTAMLDVKPRRGGGLPLVALGLLIMPFLGGVTFSRMRLRGFTLVVVLAGACVVALVTGCGSSNSGSSSSSSQPQSYVVTVTATSGTLSHSTTVALTVQ